MNIGNSNFNSAQFRVVRRLSRLLERLALTVHNVHMRLTGKDAELLSATPSFVRPATHDARSLERYAFRYIYALNPICPIRRRKIQELSRVVRGSRPSAR